MNDKTKILEAVREGKMTPEDARKALNGESSPSCKTLHIDVNSSDGDTVKIAFPIALARALFKGQNRSFHKKRIEDYDVDWSEVFDLIEDGHCGELVNVNSSDGDTVTIKIV